MIGKNRRINVLTTLTLFMVLSAGVGVCPNEAQPDYQFILAGVEFVVPVAIQAFDQRLARMMQIAGQDRLTRTYTDDEMQLFLIDKMRQGFGSALQEPAFHICPEGVCGSFRINFGGVSTKLRGSVILRAVNRRFQVQIRELKIDGMPVSAEVLKKMDKEINRMLETQQFSLDVNEFRTGEGTALISVEIRQKL